MTVRTAIQERRSYRAFLPATITEDMVTDLAECASLAPSCNNKQPWRFVFVYSARALAAAREALAEGNAWAKLAPLLVAVASRKEDDCVIEGREYHLFDTGMATAHIMLRAVELGLATHGMAGFDEVKIKAALNVPAAYTVIALFAVGVRNENFEQVLKPYHLDAERTRPGRLPLGETAFRNSWGNPT